MMSDTGGITSRSSLEFVRQTKDVFSFLERDHGFTIDEVREPTYVRYRNGSRIVVVSHGRSDFMVDAEVGKRVGDGPQARDDAYSLYVLVGAVASELAETSSARATTPESVRAQLLQCAALLRDYCMPAVRGEEWQFEQAVAFGKRIEEQREAKHRAVWERRKEAAAAWRRRDYETTRRLLENLGGDLDDDEQERLAWIRSHGS